MRRQEASRILLAGGTYSDSDLNFVLELAGVRDANPDDAHFYGETIAVRRSIGVERPFNGSGLSSEFERKTPQ